MRCDECGAQVSTRAFRVTANKWIKGSGVTGVEDWYRYNRNQHLQAFLEEQEALDAS